jgi:excisionase family DNA binding protein
MTRLLTLAELCAWLNITEGHARKLVERDAIPYRKVGRLLRFAEAEIDAWSHPERAIPQQRTEPPPIPRRFSTTQRTCALPKSLIE